jgi:hypothetical protein
MYKISVSEQPPKNDLYPLPLPGFEPNLCLNEKGRKFEF